MAAEVGKGWVGWAGAIGAGVVGGFTSLVSSMVYATMILPPELRGFMFTFIGLSVFSMVMLNVVAGVTSQFRGSVVGLQDVPSVMFALSAATMVAAVGDRLTDEALFLSLLMFCAVVTVAAGALLWLVGQLRVGSLGRFIPYSVIGGFLAATAFMVLLGGISVLLERPLTLATADQLMQPQALAKLAVAVAIALLLHALNRRLRSPLVIPLAVIVLVLGFQAVRVLLGLSIEQLAGTGWLLPIRAGQSFNEPLPLVLQQGFEQIDWAVLWSPAMAFPGLFVVMLLAILVKSTALELSRGHDIDLNRELRSVGLQNMLAGPVGGLPGYLSTSSTLLADRMGPAHRGVSLGAVLISALLLVFGDQVVAAVPTPLLGGLLLWISADLLFYWIVRARQQLALAEYVVVLLILGLILVAGFTWGLVLGLACAVGVFVAQYSRSDVIRHALTGSEYQSHLDRSEWRIEALRELGGAILIVRVQGFLFFGTSEQLRHRILALIAEADQPVTDVILDSHWVTGIDAAAVSSFQRLLQAFQHQGVALVMTRTPASVRQSLEAAALNAPRLSFEDDPEQALYGCENALLQRHRPEQQRLERIPLRTGLEQLLGDGAGADAFARWFACQTLAPGETLVRHDAVADTLYLVESGRAVVRSPDGLLVAGLGPGAVIGEIAFYLRSRRSASVIAVTPLVVWACDRSALEAMATDAPAQAARLHQALAAVLAQRLTDATRLADHLSG